MKKIMIVDDSPEIIFTLKDGLENSHLDCEVITFDGGQPFLDYIKENPSGDLIILDIMMPKVNGWEVLKILKNNAEWEKSPIIFLTAKIDNFSKGYGKLIAEEYMEKPFDMNKLIERIENLLNKPKEFSDEKKKVINDLISNIPTN